MAYEGAKKGGGAHRHVIYVPSVKNQYKHIIQVENKNVGLKVCVCVWGGGGGGGHKHTIAPQSKKWGGWAHAPFAPPPHTSYSSDIYIYILEFLLFAENDCEVDAYIGRRDCCNVHVQICSRYCV